jgi:hypothetical protein
MIRISISAAAFEAIANTMPFGSVGSEHEPDAKGDRGIWPSLGSWTACAPCASRARASAT